MINTAKIDGYGLELYIRSVSQHTHLAGLALIQAAVILEVLQIPLPIILRTKLKNRDRSLFAISTGNTSITRCVNRTIWALANKPTSPTLGGGAGVKLAFTLLKK